ncbi:hypothetical protein C493_01300 [Natronolimnohabitans innermongolicus JCM 12255]|uniref:Uncharacterized protein n=1 Tax=Natronolimnohabitans innermongolicus JCM 12255 TaxID=1227499 RepID=L9XJD6_9EURY|nr:hypothetical protein C493_01300 [Natronolimnohabitans innermongolicus JCM 12255]
MTQDILYRTVTAWLLAAIGFYLYAIGHGTNSFGGRTGAVAPSVLEPLSHLLLVVIVLVLIGLPAYAVFRSKQ